MGGYYHCYEYSLKISKKLYTNHSFPRIGDFHKVVPPIPKQRWEFFSITNCFFCEILVHNMILKDIWRLKETSSFERHLLNVMTKQTKKHQMVHFSMFYTVCCDVNIKYN